MLVRLLNIAAYHQMLGQRICVSWGSALMRIASASVDSARTFPDEAARFGAANVGQALQSRYYEPDFLSCLNRPVFSGIETEEGWSVA
jgi:hypothetical protein